METLQGPVVVAVDVSKLMGSESFSSGVGVRTEVEVQEVEVRQLEGTSVDRSSGLPRRKEITLWGKVHETEFHRHAVQQFTNNVKDASEGHSFGSTHTNPSLTPGLDAMQSHRGSGKVGRNSASHFKRPRIVQMDDSVNKSGEDIKGISTELSANPTNYKNGDRTQMPKQRQNSSGKRNDKRNGKVTKSNFSLKNGLVSFGSAAGGKNFLGMYGLKSDAMDVTKDVDDLPLSELLDGSFKCTLFSKEKVEKTSSSSGSIMQLVRDACSVLRLQKSVRVQNCACVDGKPCCVHPLVVSSLASQNDGDEEETKFGDLSSPDQECSGKVQTVATECDAPPLYAPKDVLERLALSPSKDLDCLLMDSVKPSSSRNSSDLRLSKLSSQRNGLPPFAWSHMYSGHYKSVPDAAKLSTSKMACQGRWVRVENTLTPLKGSTGFLVELQSLTHKHKLDPTGGQGPEASENENTSSNGDAFSLCERISSSFTASTTSEVSPAESPRLLAAAETLCGIATHSLKRNTQETIRLLKKPSQKGLRAFKSSENSEKPFIAPKAVVVSNNLRAADGILPSKKLRLSVDLEKPDRKGPIACSVPPIRSSAVKSFRERKASGPAL